MILITRFDFCNALSAVRGSVAPAPAKINHLPRSVAAWISRSSADAPPFLLQKAVYSHARREEQRRRHSFLGE